MSEQTIPANHDSRCSYFIRHIQKQERLKGQTTDHYKEFVNQYKTMDEVQERFDYWIAKPETMIAQIIMSVVTSEIMAEWRKGNENVVDDATSVPIESA